MQTNFINFYNILPSLASLGRFTTTKNGNWHQTKLCLTSFSCSTLLSGSCALLTNNIYILSPLTGNPVRKGMKLCLPLIRNCKQGDAHGGSDKVEKCTTLTFWKHQKILFEKTLYSVLIFLTLGGKKWKKKSKQQKKKSKQKIPKSSEPLMMQKSRKLQQTGMEDSQVEETLLSYSQTYSLVWSKMLILCFE